MQPDDKNKDSRQKGGESPDDARYRRVTVLLNPDEPLAPAQLPDVLALLDDKTGGRDPGQLGQLYHELVGAVPGFGHKLLALRLARQLGREWAPKDPERLASASALLLRLPDESPYNLGYLARYDELPQDPPSGPYAAAQAWVTGWLSADLASEAQRNAYHTQLVGTDYDARLGRPGAHLRDTYAYRLLLAQARRQDPASALVPVLCLVVEGQGTFTAPLADRLRFLQLTQFLHDAGVLGDHYEGAGDIGAITYHLWTPQQLAELPEWPG